MSHNRKNIDWTIPEEGTVSIGQAHLAVLMDIRDELQELNSKFCRYGINQVKDDINRIDRRLQNNGLLVTKPRKKA